MLKFLFVVLIMLKTNGILAQDHSINPSLKEAPLYNTLYGTDCSIPQGVQFVHYPMLHPARFVMPIFWKHLFKYGNLRDDFVHYEVAYSSFSFIQFIKKNPTAVVFDEMLIGRENMDLYKDLRDRYINYPKTQLIYPDIFYKFDDLISSLWNIQTVNSYEQLTFKEVNILSRSTGGIIAYISGLLNSLYPVTFLPHSEFVEIYFDSNSIDALFNDRKDLVNHLISLTDKFNASNNEIKKEKIKQDFYFYYKKLIQLLRELSDYTIHWREESLFNFVIDQVRKKDLSDKPIVIAFGAGHDFEDDFAEESFYTLPFSCTLPLDAINFLLDIGITRYLVEESEFNREILRQFIEQQWNRMSVDQKKEANHVYRDYTGFAVFIPLSEVVRRILTRESVSDEEKNFEFVFNNFIKMSPEEMKKL